MIEVMAVEVVDGATVRMGPPSMADNIGASVARACNCSHPSPSRTTRST